MADRQFNPLGTVSAPAEWVLPPSLQLLLKQVYATFDGTSAAAPYLPCLEIISDSGHVIGDYPVDTSIAAGASADVTWFPGLKPKTVSAATGGALSFMTYFTTSTTITALATPAYMDGSTFSPNVSGVFASGSHVIGGNTYHGVSMLAAGTYLVMGQLSGAGTTTGDLITFQNAVGGGSSDSGWIQGSDHFLSVNAASAGEIINYVSFLEQVTAAPTTAEIWSMQNNTHASGHGVAQIAYFYLGTGTLT